MFIDELFDTIVRLLGVKFGTINSRNVLDGIRAINITDMVNIWRLDVKPIQNYYQTKAIKFFTNDWFEFSDDKYDIGILSTVTDHKDSKKRTLKVFKSLMKNLRSGLTVGGLDKRKPDLSKIHNLHNMTCVINFGNNTVEIIGVITRALDRKGKELAITITANGLVPSATTKEELNTRVKLLTTFSCYVLAAQDMFNSGSDELKLNETAKLTIPDKSRTDGFDYKIIELKPGRLTYKRYPNSDNTGYKQKYHMRRGHPRKLKQKDGTIKTIWINSYHAGDKEIGEIHHDYKL